MKAIAQHIESFKKELKMIVTTYKAKMYNVHNKNFIKYFGSIDKLKVSNPKEENRPKKETDPQSPLSSHQEFQYKCNGRPRR